MKNLPYDPLNDFVPIMKTFTFPSVLVVPAASPVKTAVELVELGRTKSGGLAFASQGMGSGGHLLGTMLQRKIGKPMTHAPYKGSGQAMPDVAAGRVDLIFASYGAARPFVEAGTVRLLAVTSKSRLAELPNLPTLTEVGMPEVSYDVWFGLCALKGTPAAIVKAIYEKANPIVTGPDFVAKLRETGLTVETNTPEQFREMIKTGIVSVGQVIKEAGVVPQ